MSIYSDRRKRILEMKLFSENKLKLEERYKFWDSFLLNRYYFDFFLMSLLVVFTVLLGYKLDGHDLQWWCVFLPLAIFEIWMLFSVISTCFLAVTPARLQITYTKYRHKGSYPKQPHMLGIFAASTEGMNGLGTSVRNASCVPFGILYLVSLLFIVQVHFPKTIPSSVPLSGVVIWWISFICWLLVDMRKYSGDRAIGSVIIACMAPWVLTFIFLTANAAGANLHPDVVYGPVWISLGIIVVTVLGSLLYAAVKRRRPKGLEHRSLNGSELWAVVLAIPLVMIDSSFFLYWAKWRYHDNISNVVCLVPVLLLEAAIVVFAIVSTLAHSGALSRRRRGQ